MNYKEVSYKFVNGVFTGRIYEFKDGETITNEKYSTEEEFDIAVEEDKKQIESL